MWREYSSEKPARPFLAIVATAVILCATVCLAWAVAKPRPRNLRHVEISLPNWPILFQLPVVDGWQIDDSCFTTYTSPLGMAGSIVYLMPDPHHGAALVLVGFETVAEGTTADQAAERMTGEAFDDAERLLVGPMEGLMKELRTDDDRRHYAAVACSADGLAVAVQHVTSAPGRNGKELLEAVCRSIEYKAWWVARPPWWALPDLPAP